MTAKGVRKIKYIKNITTGETILPNNSPNFIQRLLRGVNNFEFNKPSIRKITPINKDQIIISFEFRAGQTP